MHSWRFCWVAHTQTRRREENREKEGFFILFSPTKQATQAIYSVYAVFCDRREKKMMFTDRKIYENTFAEIARFWYFSSVE